MSKKKHYNVVDHEGLPCPRCGALSETRKHKTPLSDKVKRQPYYYTLWFKCTNQSCKTEIFMSDDYKVLSKNAAAKKFENLQEDQNTLAFISKIQ